MIMILKCYHNIRSEFWSIVAITSILKHIFYLIWSQNWFCEVQIWLFKVEIWFNSLICRFSQLCEWLFLTSLWFDSGFFSAFSSFRPLLCWCCDGSPYHWCHIPISICCTLATNNPGFFLVPVLFSVFLLSCGCSKTFVDLPLPLALLSLSLFHCIAKSLMWSRRNDCLCQLFHPKISFFSACDFLPFCHHPCIQ